MSFTVGHWSWTSLKFLFLSSSSFVRSFAAYVVCLVIALCVDLMLMYSSPCGVGVRTCRHLGQFHIMLGKWAGRWSSGMHFLWYVWLHSEQALACADFMLPSWEGVLRLHVTHISLGVGISSMRTSARGFPPFSVLLTMRTCPVRAYPSAWGGLKATWRPSRLLCSPFPSGS